MRPVTAQLNALAEHGTHSKREKRPKKRGQMFWAQSALQNYPLVGIIHAMKLI